MTAFTCLLPYSLTMSQTRKALEDSCSARALYVLLRGLEEISFS